MNLRKINFRSPSVLLGTFLAVVGMAIIIAGFTNIAGFDNSPPESPSGPVDIIPPPEPEPVVYRATIAAVGDLLIHTPINQSVRDPRTGTYDYTEVFSQIEGYIETADFAIANLETRMAGADRGYSGYPLFNTPDSFATTISTSGFDLVAMANNHSMDMGVDGILNTLGALDDVDLPAVGNYSSQEEHDQIHIEETNSIKVAFLNYTERTNGIPVPSSTPYICNVLDIEKIQEEAYRARTSGADFVIALLHFGEEYQRQNRPDQSEMVQSICEAGVDFVIGSHPHVVQPIKRFVVERDGVPTECWVAYSLGNFISNQRDRYTDSGIILYLDLKKDDLGTVVDDVYYLPVYVQKTQTGGKWNYRILPVHPEIDPKSDIPLSESDLTRMDQVWEELYSLLVTDTNHVHPWEVKSITPSQPDNLHL